jgi:hypothetical protein
VIVRVSAAKDFSGAAARRSKAIGIAAPKTRLDTDRLLLGEDEFVEGGEAQTISVVAVTNMQLTISLE